MRANRYTFFPRVEKLCSVSLASRPIHHPNQLRIESIAGSTLFGCEVRVLELDYPTSICLHICDVLFTGFCLVDNLLPVDRKLSFPNAVPFCFLLPPRVAEAASLVSPMPNPDFSALGNHRVIASRTLA